jgi:TonB family protein
LSAFFVSMALISFCFGQDTDAHASPTIVPEKIMAARLLHFEVPALDKRPLSSLCSNVRAVLKVIVDKDGKVSSVHFLSGSRSLEKPAVSAVKQWSYKPYELDGQPVAVETRVSIFYLADGDAFPAYVPDGKGGTNGVNAMRLLPGCGPEPVIK